MNSKIMFAFSLAILALVLIQLAEAGDKTTHIDKCDKHCNAFKGDKKGKCGACCQTQGFDGGRCGDVLSRHCRCDNKVTIVVQQTPNTSPKPVPVVVVIQQAPKPVPVAVPVSVTPTTSTTTTSTSTTTTSGPTSPTPTTTPAPTPATIEVHEAPSAGYIRVPIEFVQWVYPEANAPLEAFVPNVKYYSLPHQHPVEGGQNANGYHIAQPVAYFNNKIK